MANQTRRRAILGYCMVLSELEVLGKKRRKEKEERKEKEKSCASFLVFKIE